MIRRWRQGGLEVGLWLGLSGLLACGGPSHVPEIEYSGCWAVYLPGPVCALYPSDQYPPRIKLWVQAEPGAEVEILADGSPQDVGAEAVKDGLRLIVEVPPRTSLLTVRLRGPNGPSSLPWSLRLAPPEIPTWLAQVDLIRHRDVSKARDWLARGQFPAREEGLRLRSLAYIALQAGDHEEADTYYRQAIAANRAAHQVSGLVEMTIRRVQIHVDQGLFGAAREILETLELPPEAPANSKYLVLFDQAILAQKTGDYRSALSRLQEAADLAERVGMMSNFWKARQVQANLLQELGRFQEAADLFEQLLRDPPLETPCDKGSLWTNAAWSRLLVLEAGQDAEDPTPMLLDAKKLFDEAPCARPDQRLNARLNLALAHLQAQRWSAAKRELAEVRALQAQPTLEQLLWSLDLEARLALAEGHPELALRFYDELGRRAGTLSLDGRFRASLGQALALLSLGRRDEAAAALAAADGFVDEQLRQVPMQSGRDTFLGGRRQEATRLYLEILLDEGQWQRALDLVRRTRSRLLRQLVISDRLARLTPAEQQEWDRAMSSYLAVRAEIEREAAVAWSVPLDQQRSVRRALEARLARALQNLDHALARLGDYGQAPLSPPRPGEVVLTYYLLQGDRWVGFAAHGQEVEVHPFVLSDRELADPASLSRKLVEPFHTSIARAERVRVLPYGLLRQVDFHALPFEGEPLLTSHEVAYGLDLPPHSSYALPGRPVALLVSDPRGDLSAARKEAAGVSRVVRTWSPGWTLNHLSGQRADAEAVRQALPGAELFHYAGHARFSGFGGWESELALADDSGLTPGDILALGAPAWVLLSSCVSAQSSEQAPGEGIGLAHAFLAAGARGVVAATRPVDDRVSRDLMRELYNGWQPGEDLAAELRRAQLAYRKRHPESSDWASFRFLER